jgi:hypothetical protein
MVWTILEWHLLWQQRVKANLSGLAPQHGPAARSEHSTKDWRCSSPAFSSLISATCETAENTGFSLALGEPIPPFPSCHGPTRPPWGSPSVSQALKDTHPVPPACPTQSSCLGPAPFYYSQKITPPIPSTAPAPTSNSG